MKHEKVFVFALLFLFALQAFSSLKHTGLTTDELAHIPAGYSYIAEHDFRMNPEHPALMKSLAGLFLIPLSPVVPLNDAWHKPDQWVWGAQFMFFSSNAPYDMLFYARIPMILSALLLGFYVWRWSRELYGVKPALFALTLFTFSPNLLAHARLVTTDVGVATFAFITVYYFYHALEKGSTKNWIKAGTALGLALGAKFTGVYLFIILPLLAIAHMSKAQQQDPKKYALKLVKPAGIVLVAAFTVLLLIYQIIGIPAYFVGLYQVIIHSRLGHAAYLMGMYSQHGWWYYFIVTFLIKTPIALLLLLIARAFYKEVPAFSKNTIYLLLPSAIFFVSFMLNKINIGHRHILAIYPFLYVWVSPLADVKNLAKRSVVALLLVWYIVVSVMIYPYYLAYFNEFVGPESASEYVIDSNVDWGQDLPGLKSWMGAHGMNNITMAYFGLDSRDEMRIGYNQLKCRPTGGIIAVSVNRLVGLREEEAECTKWLREFTPIDNIGHSILIYNISDAQLAVSGDKFCKEECRMLCEGERLALASSSFNESCKCSCF